MFLGADQLKSACDQASSAIYLTTTDATIVYANEATVRITGFDMDRLIGGTPSLFSSGLTSKGYYQRLWRALLAGNPWREVITNRRADGSLYECIQTLTPYRDDNGVLQGYIVIQCDVSEWGGAQHETRSVRSDVEQELKEKEILLREITHRTKNDLERLRSILSLQIPLIGSEDARQAVAAAERRIAVMGQIYDSFHERDTGARMLPWTMLSKLAAYWEDTIPNGKTNFNCGCQGLYVPERIGVALGIIMNEIVTNVAKHATVDGGNLRIEVDLSVPTRGTVQLTVTDDGPGFPTGVSDGSRWGLGLTIINALVEQYDGSFSLTNCFEPDKATPVGAQITVILRGDWDENILPATSVSSPG